MMKGYFYPNSKRITGLTTKEENNDIGESISIVLFASAVLYLVSAWFPSLNLIMWTFLGMLSFWLGRRTKKTRMGENFDEPKILAMCMQKMQKHSHGNRIRPNSYTKKEAKLLPNTTNMGEA